MRPLVSIIVPVYKTDIALIERCLKSIFAYKQQDLEVLLIDDGNEEIYAKRLDDMQCQWVRIIHKTHAGLSAARNTGILEAHGKYIGFVDGDDTVTESYLEEAIDMMERYDLDVAVGGVRYQSAVDPLKYKDYCFHNENNRITVFQSNENVVFLKNIFVDGTPTKAFSDFTNGSVSWKLYRKGLLTQIKFDEKLILLEDRIFNLEVFARAGKIGVTSTVWYTYYQYGNSMIHSYKTGTLENATVCLQHAMKITEQFPETLPYACRWYMSNIYTSIYLELLHENNKLNFIKNSKLLKNWLKSDPWKVISKSFDYSLLPIHSRIAAFWCIHRKAMIMLVYYRTSDFFRKIQRLCNK